MEKEHFANKIVLSISVSMCLHGFAYRLLAVCVSGWSQLCQLLEKDRAGSSHSCVL